MVICQLPECQTTAGCVCAPWMRPSTWKVPTASQHTNCWCATDVVRCSLPDCPRAAREQVRRKQEAEIREVYEKARML